MRFASCLVLACACVTTGCAGIVPLKAPPPPAPRKIEPAVRLPDAPPPVGGGRVVLDAEGEEAAVARVRASAEGSWPETICIRTPCAVDLEQGRHMFVFTSAHAMRSSRAQVDVRGPSTTIVRHALGNDGLPNWSYAGGVAMVFGGAGLTGIGALTTAVGAFMKPTRYPDGTMSEPASLLVPGLVVLGAGLLLAGGGLVLMSKNRPVQQDGSTTTWKKE
jgi:hypothetical protein